MYFSLSSVKNKSYHLIWFQVNMSLEKIVKQQEDQKLTDRIITFFDTETTGLDMSSDITQFAYLTKTECHNSYYKTNQPIWVWAMEKTGIDDEKLAQLTKDSVEFKESDVLRKLQNENKHRIFVCHNSEFDIGQLKKYGLIPNKVICTYKVAKNILEDEEWMESYRLNYIRYFFNKETKKLINTIMEEDVVKNNITWTKAHDALMDIIILKAVFAFFVDKMKKDAVGNWRPEPTFEEILKEMIRMTNDPILLKKVRFGKYKGTTFEELVMTKKWRDYMVYLKNNMEQNKEDPNNTNPFDNDLYFSLQYYLESYKTKVPTSFDLKIEKEETK